MRRAIDNPGSVASTTKALMPCAPMRPVGAYRRRRACGRTRNRNRRCRRSRSRSWCRRADSRRPCRSRAASHGRHIRAGLGLGERERRDGLAARDARQITRLQCGAAGERDRAAAKSLHREREVGESVVIGKRLADQAYRPRIEILERPAELAPYAVARQARRRPSRATSSRQRASTASRFSSCACSLSAPAAQAFASLASERWAASKNGSAKSSAWYRARGVIGRRTPACCAPQRLRRRA